MDTMNKYHDIQTKYQQKYKERMEKQYLIGILLSCIKLKINIYKF